LAGRKYDFTYITEKEIMEILCMIQVSKQESGVYLWVNTVRHFFDYCISQGVRPDNPLEKIKIQNPFYKSKK
ncbi:MAG: hypothetical protein LBI03_09850, partial [Clostridiales bacterium]|jgi:site-specific recombinase XerD|nr:hypothetical protein [Clostridiales bacterium]